MVTMLQVQVSSFLLVVLCCTSLSRFPEQHGEAATRAMSCNVALEAECGADRGDVFDCAQCAGTHQVCTYSQSYTFECAVSKLRFC